MNHFSKPSIMAAVRRLAATTDVEKISRCIEQQMARNTNDCMVESGDDIRAMNILSRALVVRRIMDTGIELPDAMRELGRRMRLLS